MYELEDIGEINSQIGQMKRELKLFYTEERGNGHVLCGTSSRGTQKAFSSLGEQKRQFSQKVH